MIKKQVNVSLEAEKKLKDEITYSEEHNEKNVSDPQGMNVWLQSHDFLSLRIRCKQFCRDRDCFEKLTEYSSYGELVVVNL